MKRFIRYLYEYNQGRRLRNVGFIKVEQGEEECAVHIHGKGLHMKGEKKLSIYLFYEDGDECVGIWQGTVDNVNPAINYRLYYTKEDVGVPGNFTRINGIILESETGHRYAAVWDDMPVDIEHMRVWRQKPEGLEERMRQEVTQREERMEEIPEAEAPEKVPSENTSSEDMPTDKVSEEKMEPENSPSEEGEEVQMMEEACAENVKSDSSSEAQPASPFKCSKIQRSELARLPRCEWKWSNNSFLLHGYYNYHHLVLLDDGERLRLGVPGIYHPQEAKAAGAFGFSEFVPIRDIRIELTEEEKNDQEQFGYWCRYVKRQPPR
ncbi:DUF6128 domain-containing protein [Bariatricus sp. SGI.154]|uniref:DUF6128 domain-containing protein n=1 Tax=Bariatricus sp. SGI.154 TaxID=3420549 RepID=UPI003CFCF33C